MKKVKIYLAVILVLAFAFSMVACSTTKTPEVVAPAEPAVAAKQVIGFSVYDMQYGFFQDMEKGTKAAIEAAGYDYKLHDEKSDETQMVSGSIDLINQGIAALIISPNKPEALGPIVEAAHAKKIPVIVDDIGGGGSNYDAIVISDCFGGGKLAAEYAIANIKD